MGPVPAAFWRRTFALILIDESDLAAAAIVMWYPMSGTMRMTASSAREAKMQSCPQSGFNWLAALTQSPCGGRECRRKRGETCRGGQHGQSFDIGMLVLIYSFEQIARS
jgi:hypothetical protein